MRSLRLFDAQPCAHAQAKRFLDPEWKGLPGGPSELPLRPVMAKLASGEATLHQLLDDDSEPVKSFFSGLQHSGVSGAHLLHWCSTLVFVQSNDVNNAFTELYFDTCTDCWFVQPEVRIAERSVEGRRSLIHRIRERAPAASMAYLSSEIRYQHLERLAATEPKTMIGLQQYLYGVETSAGFHIATLSLVTNRSIFWLLWLSWLWFYFFRPNTQHPRHYVPFSWFQFDLHTFRKLLGITPSQQLMALADSEIAKLLYRDTIAIKHGNRQRLANELQALSDQWDEAGRNGNLPLCDAKEKPQHGGPLSKALVQYLVKVGAVGQWCLYGGDNLKLNEDDDVRCVSFVVCQCQSECCNIVSWMWKSVKQQ